MPVLSKLLDLPAALARAADLRSQGRRVVMTNGCFDLLHPGHIVHLQQAADLGDALFVALNSDTSVRALKGEGRPVYDENQRTLALSALACVDTVVVFEESSPVVIMERLRPEVYVKGGDYTLDTLPDQERSVLQRVGAAVHILPQVQDFSTTGLIRRMRQEA